MKPSSNGLLTQVSIAHLVSHLHIMTVPALLPLLPDAMQVSFVELGFAIGLFNIVSALVQAPLGFLVDRLGARRMLMGALLLGAASFGLVAIFPSYPYLLATMVLAGLANGVYHPANYSLLSRGTPSSRMGRAFSIHTFAGFLGGALAPPIMIGVALAIAPRWSFAIAALAGLVAWGVMVISGSPLPDRRPDSCIDEPRKIETRPLTTPVMTLAVLTLLFTLLSLSTGALEKFSVSALVQGFDVALPAGAEGRTFGIVSTGFNVGGIIGPILFGFLLDRELASAVLWAAAGFMVATTSVVLFQERRPRIKSVMAG